MASYRVATSDFTTDQAAIINHEPIPEEESADNRYGMDSYRVATSAAEYQRQPKTDQHTGSMATIHSQPGTDGAPASQSSSTRILFDGGKKQLGCEPWNFTPDAVKWLLVALVGVAAGLVLGLIVHFSYYNPMVHGKMGKHRRQPINEEITLPMHLQNVTLDDAEQVVHFVTQKMGRTSANDVLYDFKKGWVVNRDRDLDLCFVQFLNNKDLIDYGVLKVTADLLVEGENHTIAVNNYEEGDFNFTTRNLTDFEKNAFSDSIVDLCDTAKAYWFVEPLSEDSRKSFCRTCLPRFYLLPYSSSEPSGKKLYNIYIKSVDCPTYGICV